MMGGNHRDSRRPLLYCPGPIKRLGPVVIGDQSIRHRRDEAAAGTRGRDFSARQIVFHEIAARYAEFWAHWGAQFFVTDRNDESGVVGTRGEVDFRRRRADIVAAHRTAVAAVIE